MKTMSRRRFLKISAKGIAALAVAVIFPLKLGYAKVKKIIIKTKLFNRGDLYKKHNLAG